MARLDRARTFEQFPDRANDAAADQVCENQSDNRGKDCRDRRDHNCPILLRPDRCDGAIARLHHVGANGIDFFVEFVAELVSPRETASHCREIPGVELQKQLARHLVEIEAEFAHQAVDPAVDAPQCRVVRRRTGVFNDRVD